jgi:DNA-binding NarL/FixJ family response regulator
VVGNCNSDIASLLSISEETVKGHVKHLMEKLAATDRTEAVAIGLRPWHHQPVISLTR